MKLLFIGGTGLISSACSDLAVAQGHDLFILNRSFSRKNPIPEGSTLLQADIYTDEARLASLLADPALPALPKKLVRVANERGLVTTEETEQAMICDGIVVLPKDATLPDGWSL
jgi:hypothetical protein